jgi:hypothetical protein
MHYANKQLEMKNRVIKTTCGNGLAKAAELSTDKSSTINGPQYNRPTTAAKCDSLFNLFFVSATRSNHCL